MVPKNEADIGGQTVYDDITLLVIKQKCYQANDVQLNDHPPPIPRLAEHVPAILKA